MIVDLEGGIPVDSRSKAIANCQFEYVKWKRRIRKKVKRASEFS
jgi:hypothetical protein